MITKPISISKAVAFLSVFIGLPLSSISQDKIAKSEAEKEKIIVDHWLSVATEIAHAYVITPIDAPGSPFQLIDSAIFRHTQPLRGDDVGAVYLWKEPNGRPAVVGVVFAWSQGRIRNVMHEFHSLFVDGVSMELPGKSAWTTKQPGLQWRAFPKTPAPDTTERKRKLEAKSLARRISANATDPARLRSELRLIPTPLYEYSVADGNVEYGVLFSFCQGTDTELIVLLEARKMEDKREWYYAYATFTDYQLSVAIDSESPWQSPEGFNGENGKPHFWGKVESRPRLEIER